MLVEHDPPTRVRVLEQVPVQFSSGGKFGQGFVITVGVVKPPGELQYCKKDNAGRAEIPVPMKNKTAPQNFNQLFIIFSFDQLFDIRCVMTI